MELHKCWCFVHNVPLPVLNLFQTFVSPPLCHSVRPHRYWFYVQPWPHRQWFYLQPWGHTAVISISVRPLYGCIFQVLLDASDSIFSLVLCLYSHIYLNLWLIQYNPVTPRPKIVKSSHIMLISTSYFYIFNFQIFTILS